MRQLGVQGSLAQFRRRQVVWIGLALLHEARGPLGHAEEVLLLAVEEAATEIDETEKKLHGMIDQLRHYAGVAA